MIDNATDEVERTCNSCEVVVYDVPYYDENGTGYLNPRYCPLCGKPLHDDWVECYECGDPIDFRQTNSYAKTDNDERFWHDDCAPEIVTAGSGTER